ncbi:hypothetical protein U1Q18_014048, partial [Sarracenia purpurea var. burkii]
FASASHCPTGSVPSKLEKALKCGFSYIIMRGYPSCLKSFRAASTGLNLGLSFEISHSRNSKHLSKQRF